MTVRFFKVQISSLFVLELDDDQTIDDVMQSVAQGMEMTAADFDPEDMMYTPIALSNTDPLLPLKLRWIDQFARSRKYMLTSPVGVVLQAVTGEEVSEEEALENPA